MRLVTAQEQRTKVEKECMQLGGGWKVGSNEKSTRWSYVNSRGVGGQLS